MRRRRLPSGGRLTAFGHRGREAEGGGGRKGGPRPQRQRTNVGDVRLGGEVSDVHAPRTHKRRGRQSSADVLDVLCPDLVSRPPSGAEGSRRPTSLGALAPPRPFAGGAGPAASTHKRRGRPLGRGGVRRSCAQNAQTSGTSEQRRRPRRSLPRSGVSGPVRGRGLPPAHLPHCPRTATPLRRRRRARGVNAQTSGTSAWAGRCPTFMRPERTNVGDVRAAQTSSTFFAQIWCLGPRQRPRTPTGPPPSLPRTATPFRRRRRPRAPSSRPPACGRPGARRAPWRAGRGTGGVA